MLSLYIDGTQHPVKIVTDLINGLVEILRLETEELRDAAQQAFEPVEP